MCSPISADKKAPIEKGLTDLKEAHKNKDLPGMDSAMNELNTAWQAASQDMYNATQQAGANGSAEQQQGGTQQESSAADGNVTDVDFEEVKEEKK